MLTTMLLRCAALSFLLSPASAGEVPALFGERTHAEAAAQAEREGKLLLVDFTASWCPPCHKMDATTWIDPQVEAWVAEHAVAVQVDVDVARDVAGRYAIRAMPTVVLLRDGEELDRVTGYRRSGKLLKWLEGVRAGRSELDALRDDTGDSDVERRYALASELSRRGLDDEASGHFVWLWDHALEHDPSYAGVRLSFMAGEIETLVRRHEPTRAAFDERFVDATLAIEDGAEDRATWADWRTLSQITGRQSEAVRWMEEHVSEEGGLPGAPATILDDLAELCLEQGAERTAASLFGDLVAAARDAIATHRRQRQLEARLGGLGPELSDSTRALMARGQRETLMRPLSLALLTGRLVEAEQIEPLLLAADDSWELRAELLELLLERGAIARRHLPLAQQVLAGAQGTERSLRAEGLIERLESALDEEG